jgi:glycerate kinase
LPEAIRRQDGGVTDHAAEDPDAGASGRRVLIAPDSFKGTATAAQIAAAIEAGASAAGWSADVCPLSDGGEGFLDVLGIVGGESRSTRVTGPLGEPVVAEWRLAPRVAVVESARASGLVLAGGAKGNDPLGATSRGTGELISAAIAAGADRVIVGVGGSAMTDGGLGALDAIDEFGGIGDAEVLVACDVTVEFVDAARIFGPQKGADAHEIEVLEERLRALLSRYRRRGCDLAGMPGSGAAGGLAGGLVVAGARIVPGFDLVAGLVNLDARIEPVRLVITGEGRLDATSWAGKVVGGVVSRAALFGRDVVLIAGQVSDDVADSRGESDHRPAGFYPAAIKPAGFYPAAIKEVVDLSAVFGPERSSEDAEGCAALAAAAVLRELRP